MRLLDVSGLTKAYGGLVAVNDASFSVESGSITALIGPNGAGKTTAFDLISGIVEPQSGSVSFDGTAIAGWAPHPSPDWASDARFRSPASWAT